MRAYAIILCLFTLSLCLISRHRKILDFPSNLRSFNTKKTCFDKLATCLIGDSSKAPKVLIVGDSHTGHLANFWDIIGKKEHWSAHINSSASCPFLFNYHFKFKRQKEGFCEKRNKFIASEYKKYKVIILANYWGSPFYARDSLFYQNLISTIGKILADNKIIYLLNAMYKVDNYPLRSYHMQQKFGIHIANMHSKNFAKSKQDATNFKNIVLAKYHSIKWIDLAELLPSDLFYNAKPMLKDPNHLNDYGAEILAKEFIKQNKILIDTSQL